MNAVLVALTRPVEAATKVYPVDARRSRRSAKLASPLALVAESVPRRVSPGVFVPSDTVTATDALVSALPAESSTATTTVGAITASATTVEGCVMNRTRNGAPNTLNGALSAEAVTPADCAPSRACVTARVTEMSSKVATPLTALRVVVPARAAAEIVSVTAALAPASTFPY